MKVVTAIAFITAAGCLLQAAEPPVADISNGLIRAKIYLPDAKNGFYRSTRFDWSGIVASLKYKGHEFYGPWYYRIDPAVYDLDYDDKGVISAPFTAMIGPGEEFGGDGPGFGAIGFAEAPFGGTFVKIGVGVLRKPKEGEPPVPVRPTPPPGARGPAGGPDRYDHSRLYEIVDGGKWTVRKSKSSVEFIQDLTDTANGYGYVYRKVMRLESGKPRLIIEHSLRNTGKKTIQSNFYNHNFLVLDGEGPSQDLTITVPFAIDSVRPPTAGIEVNGNRLVYSRTLVEKDRGTAAIRGFGDSAKDYDIRVENKKLGAGYHVTADKPLASLAVWSIRTVNAVEPYVMLSVEPGKELTWSLNYEYFATDKK